jgi:hypothetical protein
MLCPLHGHASVVFLEYIVRINHNCEAGSQTQHYREHKMASHQKSPISLVERVIRLCLLLVTGM